MRLGSGISLKSRLILSFIGVTAGLFFLMYLFASNWYANNQRYQLDAFLQTESTGILTTFSSELSRENFLPGNQMDTLNNPTFVQFLSIYLQHRVNRPLIFKTTLVVADMNEFIVGASNEALNLDMRVLATQEAKMTSKVTLDNSATLFSVRNNQLHYRILQAPLEVDGVQVGTVRLACLLDPVLRNAQDFLATSGIFFLLTVLLNTVSSIFLVTLILKPVKQMSHTVQSITEEKLHSRLGQLPGKDELSMLATTFNHTLQRIETAYNLQEDLVNDLSHQLRTPLTSMRGAVELALNKVGSPAEYQSILEGNLAGIDRITALVNTMLSLAKLDSHSTKLRYELRDLRELLQEIIEELSPLWDEKEIHFGFAFLDSGGLLYQAEDPGLPVSLNQVCADRFRIHMDYFRLKQAIVNIFSNAYRHVGFGGRINIELRRESSGAADQILITIMNDGPSIPPHDLAKLFERFYQAEAQIPDENDSQPAPTSQSGGFGLGLNISRRIVEMHHGQIRAYNPQAGGAAFEISLPYFYSNQAGDS